MAGKWQIPNVEGSVTLNVTGSKVASVEKKFGGEPLMGEIDETEDRIIRPKWL